MMCKKGAGSTLLRFPFGGLESVVDSALDANCVNTSNVSTAAEHYKLLYTWRLTHGDTRGAACALHGRLRNLQELASDDREKTSATILSEYLVLLNLLGSLDPDQAWILVPKHHPKDTQPAPIKRLKIGDGSYEPVSRDLMNLADVRKEYQHELDRMAMIESGNFSIL
jgi:hypothetical protein